MIDNASVMDKKIRSDQVGSLLRPPDLLDARGCYNAGSIDLGELRRAEDAAILQVLDMQAQAGIDVVTDGEYRREAFMSELAEAVEGFAPPEESAPMRWFGPGEGSTPTKIRVVDGYLRPRRRLTAHETSFLKEHAREPFKITLPSPTFIAQGAFKVGITDKYYPTAEEMLWDLVRVLKAEIAAMIEDGITYIQLDAPHYTRYCDARQREQLRSSGIDPDQAMIKALAADNSCLDATRKSGVIGAVHMCRGNSRSRWRSEGSYEPIAEALFSTLAADRFLLEYDSERAGGFEPLRFMPKDKQVVLGLVTTKTGVPEDQDMLLRRIEEAAGYVPLENLALSPQCGFASEKDGNLLTWDEQRRKLELVAETAQKVWG